MLALIFNSGLGSRLGNLTSNRPKCLVRLATGETILHRQLRVLSSLGIRKFVITTGPFSELVEAECKPFVGPGCSFTFINNPEYVSTNYIYSMYLSKEALKGEGDVLVLHGDLVFDAAWACELLGEPSGPLASIGPHLPLPEKDFKARLLDEELREVSISIFDEECVALQPMYRLDQKALSIWLSAVEEFVYRGETNVYAENAANTVFEKMRVRGLSYEGHVLEEVDTPEDLERVSAMIELADWEAQPALLLDREGLSPVAGSPAGPLAQATALPEAISALGVKRPLVVADGFFAGQLGELLGGALAPYPQFSGYSPNPTYEQVLDGVSAFRENDCDGVVSLGGGSAIDVAKCVAAWAGLPGEGQDPVWADVPLGYCAVPHLAIPTTAGTGSESTHFAVCYVEGDKRSISHPTLQPDVCVLSPELLAGLPPHQKKATLLDALCQAIESYWSVRSCEASRAHSADAIAAIMRNVQAYLAGDVRAARAIVLAANEAGRAINITTTTAPHAMSYKLTSLYGIPHGHAVAVCMPVCWRLLLMRAEGEVVERLAEIDALVTGKEDVPYGSGLEAFEALYASLGMPDAPLPAPIEFDLLVESVNAQRLGNFPIVLSGSDLEALYRDALGV